jgi:magnesium-protoporphyrin O-methyltransferase
VDASPDYVTAARAEAQRAGVTGRVRYLTGDFVALASEIEPAGVVTLDRVVCCYADMRRLVGESSRRATKLYGLVYPRDTPLFRAASHVMSALTSLFRASFRFYVHPTADVDAIVRANGLAPHFQRHGFFWQVVVYARPEPA